MARGAIQGRPRDHGRRHVALGRARVRRDGRPRRGSRLAPMDGGAEGGRIHKRRSGRSSRGNPCCRWRGRLPGSLRQSLRASSPRRRCCAGRLAERSAPGGHRPRPGGSFGHIDPRARDRRPQVAISYHRALAGFGRERGYSAAAAGGSERPATGRCPAPQGRR